MATSLLDELKAQAVRLTDEERAELITFLASRRGGDMSEMVTLQDLRGIAPNMLGGEDAQAWVSRTRQENQEHRDRLLGQE